VFGVLVMHVNKRTLTKRARLSDFPYQRVKVGESKIMLSPISCLESLMLGRQRAASARVVLSLVST